MLTCLLSCTFIVFINGISAFSRAQVYNHYLFQNRRLIIPIGHIDLHAPNTHRLISVDSSIVCPSKILAEFCLCLDLYFEYYRSIKVVSISEPF